MRFVAAIVMLIGGVLAAAGSAQAAQVLYASPSGGGNCSSAASPCTLAVANAAAAAGDTITLARGEYKALGNVAITPGVTVVGSRSGTQFAGAWPTPRDQVSALEVGTLSLEGGALRDVFVHGGMLRANGTAIDRVIAYGGSSEAACSLGSLTARNSACWASAPGAAAVKVSGASQLRNVTAISQPQAGGPGPAIALDGPATVLVRNTSAAGAPSIVVNDAGASVSVDHSQFSQWTAPAGTVTLGAGNVGFTPVVTPAPGTACDALQGDAPMGTPRGDSAAIDAGAAVDPDELDALGRPRTRGAAPDIGAYEYQPGQPCIHGPDASLTAQGVRLTGYVDPRGAVTSFYFEWGPTPGYGAVTSVGQLPASTVPLEVSATLTGLASGTTYHARLVAVNEHGTQFGPDVLFTTPGPAPNPLPQTPSAPAEDPPEEEEEDIDAPAKVTVPLPSAKRCLAARTLSLRPRIAAGGRITAVSVYVRGKRVLRVTGAKARRTIKVKRLPRGRFTVEVRVRTSDGRTVKAKRTYRRCA
jgi:hypothetical protein